MNIFKVLDLSTAHLPEELCDSLPWAPGVIAHGYTYGYLIYVPDSDENWTDREECPKAVARIIRYAQEHGCDYVLMDADGDTVEDLPTWEW